MNMRLLHSTEAEQAILGGVLLDNNAIDRIGDVITEADFYTVDHAHIYGAMRALSADGKPVDIVSLAELLEREGTLDAVGGIAYLGELVQNVPTAANIVHYAGIVRDRRIERNLLTAGERMMDLARDTGPVSDRLDRAQSIIMGLTETAAKGEAQPIGSLLLRVIERLEERHNGDDLPGLTTGLMDLDRKLAGLKPGNLIVLAGRPGMGKSVLGENIARAVAVTGTPAVLFSLEMDAEECTERSLIAAAKLDAQKIRTGRDLNGDDWESISTGLGRLQSVPLLIDDSAGATVEQIRAKARRLKRTHNIGLVVVDYLQLMSGEGDNRTQQVDSISRGLKLLAKELRIPVVALSQLNRKLEDRTNKRPMLSDLRESGGIEQDADVVIFLYRDEVYNENSDRVGVVELIIAKQRMGPTGTVYATWFGEHFLIVDRAEGFTPPPIPPKGARRKSLMSEAGL